MKMFSGLSSVVPWHLPHEYTKESNKRSEMVCLGVLNKNEAHIADMVDILEHFHEKYVPRQNDEPVCTILYGDGLSCERVNDAHNARINAADPWSRLEGVEPAVQEWHKRGILLQDTFDKLYSSCSARGRGTLYHVRNTYMHKQVKKNVLKCFNHATELLRFATEAYIVAAACSFMGLTHENDTLLKVNEEQTLECFYSATEHILSLAFTPPSIDPISEMIPDRMDNRDDNDDDDDDDGKEYCRCKEDKGGDLIRCNNDLCQKGLWFHLECEGIEVGEIPEGDWYCSESCEKTFKKSVTKKIKISKDSKRDHIYEYTRNILWRGIGEMVRHDAIRENDGPRMIMHWKYDLMEFYDDNHIKYVIFAHRLLTCVNGGASECIAKQLVWNRTVNPSGGVAKNLEMDLQMEYFNRDYKESIKSAGGQLTEDTIARYSQMVGIGKVMAKAFDIHIAERATDHRNPGKCNRERDFSHLVKTLINNHYFDIISGRFHYGFPSFVCDNRLKNPTKFKKRLLKQQKKIIKRLSIIAN